ncbi:MAG: Peptidase family [Gemmatimonadetes bacterium]|nr:Peptidase family [Gemmatimonadota bacterium]
MIPLPGVYRSARLLALPLLLLLPAPACADARGGPSRPDPSRPADRPAFNADRAWAYLTDQVAFGPRYAGAPGHARQLRWMTDFFASVHADSVRVQPFTHVAGDGKTLRMSNVFARFQADNPERILLVAHWDTRVFADRASDARGRRLPVPGANDGASGVALIMEIAQGLNAAPPPVGVDVLLTDGEDYGPGEGDMYLGSRWFADHLPAGYRPRYALVLDMVADPDARFEVEERSRRAAPEAVARVWDLAREMGYGDAFPTTSAGEIDDDHVPLIRAGIPAVEIIDLDFGPGNAYWHSPDDLPRNASRETLRTVGEVVAELIYRGG